MIIEKKISDEENRWLCATPSKLEVKQAVFSIPKNSSLGPDGFGSGFYMSCRDIIKEDVVEAARDFFRGAPLSRFYSSSFIVLILKVPEPSSFEKFRPISLCSMAYKKFSNIIVNRLNSILDSLVSHEQAFGFSEDVCQIIANCVQSQWFSIMMNGTFHGYFQSARGLHQGDHLSPYLLILMEEVLTRLLRKNFEEGRIGKFSHPISAPLVSHLLYVDDILIFANEGKRKRSLLSLMGFKECKFPVTYLGVLLVSGRLTTQDEDILRELVSEKVVEEIL
ncbi:hypothetical protein F2P56_027088 [Juglans regia]|uniref:Reverse transcriptase domain-containing protein n=2 Tax=Juglans regia TaxID=51240 RepID=A0A833X8V3_JUGRE|nr:uncharacterized protein LOC108980415 [Juglans regia]KAF5452050.1 hypothetical protein F2P56_027088 [Juglans regia]